MNDWRILVQASSRCCCVLTASLNLPIPMSLAFITWEACGTFCFLDWFLFCWIKAVIALLRRYLLKKLLITFIAFLSLDLFSIISLKFFRRNSLAFLPS